jgi:hypothetical protein
MHSQSVYGTGNILVKHFEMLNLGYILARCFLCGGKLGASISSCAGEPVLVLAAAI